MEIKISLVLFAVIMSVICGVKGVKRWEMKDIVLMLIGFFIGMVVHNFMKLQ